MALTPFNDNIFIAAPKALDNKHGKFVSAAWAAYDSVTEANSSILSAYRSLGLTVIIDNGSGTQEYWYRDGITDDDLIPKYVPPPPPPPPNNPISSYRIDGGQIAWTQNYDYTVSFADYVIMGVQYASPQTDITLAAADPSNDRIDLVGVDTTGSVVVITGIPAANPQEPSYDPATQLPLAFIVVSAGTTQPPCASLVSVYAENAGDPTEWDVVSSSGTMVVNSTTNPRNGTYDIQGTAVATNATLTFTTSSPILAENITQLDLHIRSKGTWGNTNRGKGFSIQMYSGSTAVGVPVILPPRGAFGWNSSTTGVYQQVIINKSLFNLADGTSVDKIVFTRTGGGGSSMGFYIDDITLEQNCIISTGTGGSSITIQDEGVSLPQRSILDFVGDNVTATDDAANGRTLITVTGLITADNGLTANTSTNVQLGGTLLHNTSITGAYKLSFSSTVLDAALSVINTNSTSGATAMYVQSENVGININSNNGEGLNILTTGIGSGFAAIIANRKGAAAELQSGNSSTNSVSRILDLLSYPQTSTAANGFGGSLDFTLYTATNSGISNQIISKWTDATHATRTSQLALTGVYSGTLNDLAYFNGDGGVTLPGNFTPTYTFQAANTTNGAIFGYSQSGIGVQGQSLTNLAASWVIIPNTTTNVESIEKLSRHSTGTTGDGVGGSLDFYTQATSNNSFVSNQIISKWTTANDATRTSEWSLTGVNSGTPYTLITAGGDGAVSIPGLGSPLTTLSVTQLGNGTAVYGAAQSGTGGNAVYGLAGDGGTGVRGEGTTGLGVYGIATSGIGLAGVVNSIGLPLWLQSNPSSTSSVIEQIQSERKSSGTAANGIGQSWGFYTQTDSGASHISNQLISKWLDATDATRTSQFIITGVNNGISYNYLVLNRDTVVINSGISNSSLQFGGTTASYPMLKNLSNTIVARLADDSGYASLSAGTTYSDFFTHATGGNLTVSSGSGDLIFRTYNSGFNEHFRISNAGIFTIAGGLQNYSDDSAAATGGIPVNGLYRNGSVMMIRVS